MTIHVGYQTVAFLSVVLGSATFGVCGWIFVTYEFSHSNFLNSTTVTDTECSSFYQLQIERKFFDYHNHAIPILSNLCDPVPCSQLIQEFIQIVIRNSFAGSVASVLQVGVSVYLMAGTSQEAASRAKLWTIFCIGCNLIYVICFTSTFTYPLPVKCQDLFLVMANLKYLSAYYTVIAFDIFLGFILLISTLLLIRYEKNFGYILVLNV